MGEHPHDCPPECPACEREDAWQALCDDVGCDAPVCLGQERLRGEPWFGWYACGRCERCGVVA